MHETLLLFVRDGRPSIIAEAIDGLSSVACYEPLDAEALDEVYALYSHPSPYVKGSVLRFVSRHDPRRARPLLIEALWHPSFIVRENAVDELGELRLPGTGRLLRPLLNDANPDVRQAAEWAFSHLRSTD